MTVPEATPERPGHRVVGEFSRRTLITSAVILFGAIALGVGAIALFSDPGPPTSPASGEQVQPRMIEQPNQGTAPQDPGDRGGWEQLALFGLMAVALLGIGVVIFRGGSKTRQNREAWKAAGATGRDGAVPR